ncbi:MAG: IS21 family transposase [Rectinemataceae bacterium]
MKALRQVIELHEQTSFSNRQIAAAARVSRPAVADYIASYSRSGLSWEEFEKLTDSEAIARLTVSKSGGDARLAQVWEFFPYMLKELPRTGVTRDILWKEYRVKHPDGFEYSQFCHHFRTWCRAETEVTLTMEHKAGDRMYVDFSGAKRAYRENGVEREAEIFVAILGASQYTYVEAIRSQQKRDFITANRNALLFFGGVPAAIVPDCLKSAVSKADRYESEINPEYADFASHHGTVIFPARPHAPRDKALVEGAVNIIYTRILAPIRDRQFDSLDALNAAIGELLEAHNAKRFQKLPYSRTELFESIDRPALKPLPAIRYEYTDFRTATVGFNYHIEIREDRHSYSVPYAYARKQVSVALTARTVEIYFDNQRIAFHKRASVPGYTTSPEHRSANHRFHLEWTPERLIAWAGQTSIHTRSLVKAILERAAYPDQSFRSCIGIISFSKKYSVERLDNACRMALAEGAHSYQAVKKILEAGRDIVAATDDLNQLPLPLHENLRGQSAYQ